MVRTIHVLLTGAGQQLSWTPDVDVVLVGAIMDNPATDALISVDPSDDPAVFTGVSSVNSQLIAAWLSCSAPAAARVFRLQARKGDPIFFTADNSALFCLFYDDSAESIAT